MTLQNQNQIAAQASRLLDRLVLINNQDRRLRIPESVYKAEDFRPATEALVVDLLDFQGLNTDEHAANLLKSTRRYI
jgi:hypothetical protein